MAEEQLRKQQTRNIWKHSIFENGYVVIPMESGFSIAFLAYPLISMVNSINQVVDW